MSSWPRWPNTSPAVLVLSSDDSWTFASPCTCHHRSPPVEAEIQVEPVAPEVKPESSLNQAHLAHETSWSAVTEQLPQLLPLYPFLSLGPETEPSTAAVLIPPVAATAAAAPGVTSNPTPLVADANVKSHHSHVHVHRSRARTLSTSNTLPERAPTPTYCAVEALKTPWLPRASSPAPFVR